MGAEKGIMGRYLEVIGETQLESVFEEIDDFGDCAAF
jgi:hypothetical protein